LRRGKADWPVSKFNTFMNEQVARWSPLIKQIGIKLD
jgi:hypothetical protein